ncbi:MAG: metal ABC transporter substrate-binding protein [Candidatus Hydrothermia bacterium]
MFLILFLIAKSIATSIPPLAGIVESIAGPDYKVYSLLRSYQNPHVYELKPQDIKKAVRSDMYFEIGGHIEAWGNGLRNHVKNPVVITEEFQKRNVNYTNPHLWLDPQLVPQIAKVVAEKLSQKFPEDSAKFSENYKNFITRYTALLDTLKSLFHEHSGKKVLLYHPSWNMLLEYMGLSVAGSMVHHGEKEVSAGEYAKWIKKIKSENIAIIISEVNMPSKVPQSLASETGICIAKVDPLFEGDFVDGFKEQALKIYRALKCQK